MNEGFKSQALEANLAETRYKNIHIPAHHQSFIRLSEKYYGLHKRAAECLTEFHHPLCNKKFVTEELRKILISDFWFYSDCGNPGFAFDTIIDLHHELLKKELKQELVRIILRTLLEFNIKAFEKSFYDKIDKSLDILAQNLKLHEETYIRSSGLFRKNLAKLIGNGHFEEQATSLYRHILKKNSTYWYQTSHTREWLEENSTRISEARAQKLINLTDNYLAGINEKILAATSFDQLEEIDGFEEIAATYENFISQFDSFIEKFYYIFHLLQVPGMRGYQERLIWNINKMLRDAIEEVDNNHLPGFIDRIFELCHSMKDPHISSVLDILLTLGKKVIDRDNSEDKHIVNYFEKKLIDFGFETPGMIYVNEEWQLHVNKNHIKNIRVWLELIEYSQSIMEKLLSALIVNLKLGGIFISDTDLFQREITQILNSNIAPYYKKVKQLTRIFPVYFNEIGAEGQIRDTTTSMDEVYKRQDRLVHFLRKQVHTESNNTLINLTRKVFTFWYDGKKEDLKGYVPLDVYESIDPDSDHFKWIHLMVQHLCRKKNCTVDALLTTTQEDMDRLIEQLPGELSNEKDKLRLREMHRLYAFLKEKYSFDTVDITPMLRQHSAFKKTEIEEFNKALSEESFEKSLRLIYHFMEHLKNIIFTSETSEGWENIYHKRHIAIGIPSMYGVYREPKFEAIGLTFRLERIATRLMEKVVHNINLDYISNKKLQDIYKILNFFREGLELDGITSQAFNSNLSMLKYSLTSRSFSLEQYINIFQFMAEDVRKIISKYFLKSYEYPLNRIVPQLFDPVGKLNQKEQNRLISEKSEKFFRELIASAFLVQPLDNFISRILGSLRSMIDNIRPEWISDIMTYNSDMSMSSLNTETPSLDNQIFLGSKAYFLKKLKLSGFPVPPGFVVTTEVFRRIDTIMNHPVIRRELETQLKREISRLERRTKKRFGDPQNPLLLSVRSGTAISMPGAMDTFLNVGMNDELTEQLSRRPNFAWTSWDCYRRLLQSWGMFHGISRDTFDQIMLEYKNKYAVKMKVEFKSQHMREIAFTYKEVLKENGVTFEEDVFEQLKTSVLFVFDSWSSDRAQVYRDHLQIADEWGTAAIIQEMKLGNLNRDSGTGVVFTQNPNRQRPGVHLYGDFSLSSQGEDIVGGLVNVHPVGETQRKQNRQTEKSLQQMMPSIYKRIHDIATDLTENKGYNPQEIEFTFESSDPKDLYILQTRDQDITQPNIIKVFTPKKDEMKLAGRGTGIGGGAINGIIAFDHSDLEKLKAQHPNQNLMLVRPDTVPDDIDMIFDCNGLLTAKGGATSHAAVTAVRLGKTCVVNCSALQVDEGNKIATLGNYTFKTGDEVAIDGNTGNIYKGQYPTDKTEVKTV
ncbi:MAG: hypothetical protein K9J27_03620 [Bacteroidales bacterium]|nr:hypothetical protein [Bacteroidales bacterium]MCF8332869.1 hypothetical protein [Bacteroidales bacterium]